MHHLFCSMCSCHRDEHGCGKRSATAVASKKSDTIYAGTFSAQILLDAIISRHERQVWRLARCYCTLQLRESECVIVSWATCCCRTCSQSDGTGTADWHHILPVLVGNDDHGDGLQEQILLAHRTTSRYVYVRRCDRGACVGECKLPRPSTEVNLSMTFDARFLASCRRLVRPRRSQVAALTRGWGIVHRLIHSFEEVGHKVTHTFASHAHMDGGVRPLQ